ncbi:MAG TPA: class I SAM-dependent methyltransferase [Rhizobiaceae bacterium]|nr:class I SAM-dependent methyltransferase [Rhizobiaceae bacterium]
MQPVNTAESIASYTEHVRPDPYKDRNSMEFKFRSRRFARIQALIEAILVEKGEATILDLGGRETYWQIGADFIEANRERLRITLVNLEKDPVEDHELFETLTGDATDPALMGDRRFDLVHSNSVVEHVGEWPDMQRFAENTRRLGKRYYVQTPNYWFPFEPHFRTAGFQYLPRAARAALIQRVSLGFFPRIQNADDARDIIRHHHLISTRQMRALFPDADVLHEKFMGLNKSIIAIQG